MKELLSSSIRDSNFCPLDIPSILEALVDTRSVLSDAVQRLVGATKASINQERAICNSNYVDVSVSHELNALQQAAENLELNLELVS
jgi:hypothetical protein